jgi:hypothetical protein
LVTEYENIFVRGKSVVLAGFYMKIPCIKAVQKEFDLVPTDC